MIRQPTALINAQWAAAAYETDDGRLITTTGFHEDIIVSSRESLLKAALLVAAKFGAP